MNVYGEDRAIYIIDYRSGRGWKGFGLSDLSLGWAGFCWFSSGTCCPPSGAFGWFWGMGLATGCGGGDGVLLGCMLGLVVFVDTAR